MQSDLDTLDALSERDVRGMFYDTVYRRAEAYYQEGRVRHARRSGATLDACVQGTQLYVVRVEVLEGRLFTSCTCPFFETAACKHIGAVLLLWTKQPEAFEVVPTGEASPKKGSLEARQAETLMQGTTLAPGFPSASLATQDDRLARSNLPELLGQLDLPALQEIVRVRQWQAEAPSKADLVALLAPLFADPVEVARAATSLSPELREALRAAFIAEDGYGVSADLLAHVMTAVRARQRPTVKPVEAAGLLVDLARLGLVIRWQTYVNIPLFLLPWEVQSRIPPLPGWCQPASRAPSPERLYRDPRFLVDQVSELLRKISNRSPRVRPPTRPELDRQWTYLLGDWPYDAQEVGKWTGKPHGATRPVPLRLTVPPPAHLLDDADLQELASLTVEDTEQLEFVLSLLFELDLIGAADGQLQARTGAVNQFLRSTSEQQQAALRQAYLSMTQWSELDALLRADNRLLVKRSTAFSFPYSDFRAQLFRMRQMLLRLLGTAGEQGWCSVRDLEGALSALWPELFELQPLGGRDWLASALEVEWLARHSTASRRQGREWETPQSGLLYMMLRGPLYWLGLAELAVDGDKLLDVRFRGLAELMWGWSAEQDLPSAEMILIDEDGRRISVSLRAAPPQAHTLLGSMGVVDEAPPGRLVYRLDMRSAYTTFKRGKPLPELLQEWKEVIPVPMPDAVRCTLEDWWARHGQVHLYEGLALLEVSDDIALQELEAATSLRSHILARLSPRLVIVPEAVVESLVGEFTAKGYAPQQVR